MCHWVKPSNNALKRCGTNSDAASGRSPNGDVKKNGKTKTRSDRCGVVVDNEKVLVLRLYRPERLRLSSKRRRCLTGDVDELVVSRSPRLLIPPVATDHVVVAQCRAEARANPIDRRGEREDSLWGFAITFMLMQRQSLNTQLSGHTTT